jgi:hypothetical protein
MHDPHEALLACAFVVTLCACGDDAADATPNGDAGTNGGGDTRDLDACFADLVAPPVGFIEVQSFETEDGNLRLRRARRPGARSAVGETFPYDLVRFGVESDTGSRCVTEPARLDYAFGHHNWNERWEARTGDMRYVVREALDVTRLSVEGDVWTTTVELIPQPSGAPLPSKDLIATGCYSLPYDYNPCFRRMRTDQPPAGGEE